MSADAAGSLTTLRLYYPTRLGGITLRGNGGGLNWTVGVPFVEAAPGVWTWTSSRLDTTVEWKPLLADTHWAIGPNYTAAPGSTVEIHPRFFRINGSVHRIWPAFVSALLGNTRGVWVYLPPSYEENPAARFPVVYMQDGQNLFDAAASYVGVTWEVARAMDAGAADGTLREAIVIGIENTPDRISEYTPSFDAGQSGGGRASTYVAMLINELMPWINAQFRTLTGPGHTAIVGSSLGAIAALYAGVHRGEVFGLVGALSPSTWWAHNEILREVALIPTRSVRPMRVYVDSGDSGVDKDDEAMTRVLADGLREVGYADGTSLAYHVQAGGVHSEISWAQRFPGCIAFLLGGRKP